MATDRGVQKQIRALREAKYARGHTAARAGSIPLSTIKATGSFGARANLDAQAAIDAAKQETTVKKPKTKKTAPKRTKRAISAEKKAVKLLDGAHKRAAKKAATPKPDGKARKGIPATEVGAMICREGGASMAELEKKFGIDAHPMRAKIHYLKHNLGYKIEAKDGRYTGSAPLGGP